MLILCIVPEEGVIVNAIFPQLLAAVVRVHVKPDCILLPSLLVWAEFDKEPPSLESYLANVDPVRETTLTPCTSTT